MTQAEIIDFRNRIKRGTIRYSPGVNRLYKRDYLDSLIEEYVLSHANGCRSDIIVSVEQCIKNGKTSLIMRMRALNGEVLIMSEDIFAKAMTTYILLTSERETLGF